MTQAPQVQPLYAVVVLLVIVLSATLRSWRCDGSPGALHVNDADQRPTTVAVLELTVRPT